MIFETDFFVYDEKVMLQRQVFINLPIEVIYRYLPLSTLPFMTGQVERQKRMIRKVH